MKRRSFIRNSSCAAMGYTTLFSTLFNLKSISAAASVNSMLIDDCSGYKAMVCLFLGGGNDSFNMLTPFDGAPYTEYAATRGDLALGNGNNGTPVELLEILPDPAIDRTIGIHHALSGMKDIFDNGDLAFIANVGSLAEPIADTNEYYSGTKNIPLGLYSHSDQQKHWQTANPMQRFSKGWGGKLADMIDTANCNDAISVNVSLSGTNIFQSGNNSFSYVISPYDGSIGIQNYGAGGTFYNLRDAAMNNILDHNYQDAFKNAYASEVKDANDTHLLFSGSINSISLTNTFGTSRISKSFEMIAKTIKAATSTSPLTGLNPMKRQVFYVSIGGFDNHDEVLMALEDRYALIDEALVAFNAEMIDMGMHDDVTTFGISEFGRTLTSNGQGSDHAWGGNTFVMGGGVNGKKIYGTYPDLGLGTTIELGGGVYIPTTSADEMFAELAIWFGVAKSDLPTIFPNITEFYDINSSSNPLGFL